MVSAPLAILPSPSLAPDHSARAFEGRQLRGPPPGNAAAGEDAIAQTGMIKGSAWPASRAG